MKYLLDSHTFIWALENSNRLDSYVKDIILDENNIIYLSAVSLWEIELKHKKYQNEFPFSISELINYATKAGYVFLSLSVDNLKCFAQMDYGTHKDPFDQMLIAQSISNNMKIITHDEAIAKIIPQNTIYF